MEEVKKKTKTSSTKKKNNTKTNSKKTTISKSNSNNSSNSTKTNRAKVNVEEKVTNENVFIEKVKKFFSSYAFLYSVFAILLVFVIVLTGMIVVKQREADKKAFNIVVPILEDGNRSAFNIDLSELKERGEYVLKVSNYRGDKINTESLDYSITVRNESGVEIKVTKDEQEDNLMVDQEATIIEGVGFGIDKKEEDIYRFTVVGDSKIKKDAVISVEIATQKRSS